MNMIWQLSPPWELVLLLCVASLLMDDDILFMYFVDDLGKRFI